jgi:hypothetical protein
MRIHLVSALTLFMSLFITLTNPNYASAQSATAPQSQAPAATDDDAAIRHVAELYMSFETAKLRECFYPQSNLYVAGPQGELRIVPFDKFLENVQKGEVSGRARPTSTIDFVDHVGTAAVVKITEHSADATVTDYLSLIRIAEGWKVVAKTFYVDHKPQPNSNVPAAAPSSPLPSPCEAATAEIRAFDYMLGDWTTTYSPAPAVGTAVGTSHSEKILDGCAILEHRHIEQNGKTLFNADVIWGYDSVKKQMLLFYVDDHEHTQLYEGRRENGGWSFYRDRPDKDGTTITIRVTYAPQTTPKGNGFTQTVNRSKDHGATWELGQSATTYEPKR